MSIPTPITFNENESYFMKRALTLAKMATGKTSPNPLVGCVIVKNNLIVGEGFHAKAGTLHAERHALAAAGDKAEGADVYVTLEPCSHYGRTPPCCDALIAAKVKKVYVAMTDPNPLVSGKGIAKLKDSGITVISGLLEEESKKMNESFIKAITSKLPFVLYKAALSLDGKTALESGDSSWISSPKSREYVHQLRSELDVIMVGSKTANLDNPLLTSRIENGRDPVRIIVDGKLSLLENAKVLSSSSTAPCIIAVSKAAPEEKIKLFNQLNNVEVWQY
ncbi:MAG: bifunctional diaminohydroxyphosphoribosylaminopyrimidine deaminase/5-amino-6-(5-phosphoribosylamino)uracil reductase RibD, partial [Eubacteriales bacterium]